MIETSKKGNKTEMTKTVDSFKFTGQTIGKIIERKIEASATVTEIPWTAVRKRIDESRIALVTTAGISMKTDKPFDMETEQVKGNWGDPSWRMIDGEAISSEIDVNHLHIDTSFIEKDINVALPTGILKQLAEENAVGSVAHNHYSIMGFQGDDSRRLETVSSPEIAAAMKKDNVDLAILTPV